MHCRPLILAMFLSLPALAPALSQEVAEPQTPAPESATENQPNWPPGVESWNSEPFDPEGNPLEAERRGLTSEEVEESVDPEPTQQGTRSPEVLEGEEGEEATLYSLLAKVRTAPPGLDGQPIPRPNPLAREPIKEVPAGPRVEYDLFPENYIE